TTGMVTYFIAAQALGAVNLRELRQSLRRNPA
ncbi:MAG: hypothetical protein ACI853_000798, partial [Paracoccaceae bacterium]